MAQLIGWLTCTLADVPPDDRWLGDREREVLATLRVPKRREEWRLGRWTAKAALAASHGLRPSDVEVIAAADGAPAAFTAEGPIEVGFSLSHRRGRALVAVAGAGGAVGCDLEAVEQRSPAFVRQWLTAAERELLEASPVEARDLAANLLWTAKEAASKSRREGLRLDFRAARVEANGVAGPPGSWEPLRVRWEYGPSLGGWWRHEPGWVMSVVCDPVASAPPRELGY